MARPLGTARAVALMAASTVLIIALRMPKVLGGRFWAEEGPIFYVDLQHASLLQATGYLYRGSLQLLTNWTVWAATRVPMEWAPFVTTWLAIGALLVLAWTLLLFATSHGAPAWSAMLGFAVLMMLPETMEFVASATNLQWVCSMAVALIAFTADDMQWRRRRSFGAVVLLSGLTGVTSCMLVPVFLLRGWIGRSRGARVLAAILLVTTAVQLLVLLGSPRQPRPFMFDPFIQLLSIGLKVALQPLIGQTQALMLLMRFVAPWASPLSQAAAVVVIAAGSLGVVALSALLARKGGVSWQLIATIWVTAIAVCMLNQFGGLGRPADYLDPRNGPRYFAVGQLCLISLLVLGTAARERRAARAATLLLGVALFVGSGWVAGTRLPIGTDSLQPAWMPQVARCRAQAAAACRLYMWPHPHTGVIWTGVWRPAANTLEAPKLSTVQAPPAVWLFGKPHA